MTKSTSRREFLRRTGAFTSMGAAAPWALNFAAMSAAMGSAQAQSVDDYRALVCVFLFGGNDNHNTVVPFDIGSHNQYADIRSTIALPRSDLMGTQIVPATPWGEGRLMALHPSLRPLKTLFDSGSVALAMNVGTLTREGTSLQDYKAKRGLPPKLFSHNDQQSVWQSSLSEGAAIGWGGRMADLFASGNAGGSVFTSISAAGNAVFMAGNSTVQYQVTPQGSIAINPVEGSAAATDSLKELIQSAGANLLERGHANVTKRALAADQRVREALSTSPPFVFPRRRRITLGDQLQIVARLIRARSSLGVKRQIFFVAQGGFDLHNDLIERHGNLLASVSESMKAFFDATVEMGVQNQVTAFTASDFGRTLANNGDGSDHGWGGHHFVVGGAVSPRAWVGKVPSIGLNEAEDELGGARLTGGRLIPAIGVDQYAATLAKWFGVSDSDMPTVLPNIGNYTNRDLGFMRAI